MSTHLARFKRLEKLYLLCKEWSTFKSCLFWMKDHFQMNWNRELSHEIWDMTISLQSFVSAVFFLFCTYFLPLLFSFIFTYSFILPTLTDFLCRPAIGADSELIKRTHSHNQESGEYILLTVSSMGLYGKQWTKYTHLIPWLLFW